MPRRPHEGGDLCAIFIHAGAGYHSHQNERIHLTAVNDAARVAMAVLKNGGEAADAVEMAVRCLEDREITNAGYGSNLTMDGQVECDATVVDHFGRSGAVGAIGQVKNPIAVARLVLDESIKPLSLQRVPPNLLVGAGATDFAADKGVPILPPDFLISLNARERWKRWKQDLDEAQRKEDQQYTDEGSRPGSTVPAERATPVASQGFQTPSTSPRSQQPRPSLGRMPALTRPLVASTADVPSLSRVGDDRDPAAHQPPPTTNLNLHSARPPREETETATDDNLQWVTSAAKRKKLNGSFDGPMGEEEIDSDADATGEPDDGAAAGHASPDDRDDEITDTVGAIAVDCFGHIAAGSSSGGIGMKHRGRCGPAALVGIGTAVIPVDPQDPSETCVATVTSGTGEHMATTTAAATAADRIYRSVCKENGKVTACNEDEAMHSVIQNDFMAHPGVSQSHCTGAIGILAVKKCRDGIYFYFGHNTDSFALASMHSEERKPVCTMSRSKGHGAIAQGGRVSKSKHGRHRG